MRVTVGFFLALSAALLCAPPAVTGAVLLAAALHEAGHLLALRAAGAAAEGARVGAFGVQIAATGAALLSYPREIGVTLAGPAVNLLLAPLTAAFSARFGWEGGMILAGAHALLGAFNLLPIPPLDGGQALYLAAAWAVGPYAADRAAAVVGAVCAFLLTALSAFLLTRGGGALFLLASLGLLRGAAMQLALAKRGARV